MNGKRRRSRRDACWLFALRRVLRSRLYSAAFYLFLIAAPRRVVFFFFKFLFKFSSPCFTQVGRAAFVVAVAPAAGARPSTSQYRIAASSAVGAGAGAGAGAGGESTICTVRLRHPRTRSHYPLRSTRLVSSRLVFIVIYAVFRLYHRALCRPRGARPPIRQHPKARTSDQSSEIFNFSSTVLT